MKNKVKICRRRQNGSYTILDEKVMDEQLDEEKMEVYVIHNRKRYPVLGDCFFSYIVIGDGKPVKEN